MDDDYKNSKIEHTNTVRSIKRLEKQLINIDLKRKDIIKQIRLLKRDNTFQKDAFCSPALVEMKDGQVVTLHSELPEGAIMVDKEVSKEALKEWTLRSKEKWEKSKK